MTRKHYIVFAALISKMRAGLADGHYSGKDIINEFETVCITEFAKENPHFNIMKFREATR